MTLSFWFDFASTYSYPAAMRIEQLARARRAAVVERFFAQPNVPGAGVERLALQLIPGKGTLHVA